MSQLDWQPLQTTAESSFLSKLAAPLTPACRSLLSPTLASCLNLVAC